MPSSRLTAHDRREAKLDIKAVERELKNGRHPSGPVGRNTDFSAIRAASIARNAERNSFRTKVGNPEHPGSHFKHFGLKVDWSLYNPSKTTIGESPADPKELEILRQADDNGMLRAQLAELQLQLLQAREYRASILKLAEIKEPIRLPQHKVRQHGANGRSVVLHLSDVHYGEVVSLSEMDGTNKYDLATANVRLSRFFNTAAALMTDYWSGRKPDEIVLCLGGDLISGLIHDELNQTNAVSVPTSVRQVGDLIADGIAVLLKKVGCPIRIFSVPGNHARPFGKPQSKGRSAHSFDLLATDFAESALRGSAKNISFIRTHSPDAYFSTYGWHWLLTHGDTMGGRGGGTGFIGPMATIVKGHRKLVDTSWRQGRSVHYVLTAHYHTTGKTPFGWANGSVVGYGEYARDLRADPEPARQNMLVVHAEHGVINEQPLYLGHPSEGSLYSGPATVVRPTYREG